MTPDRISRRELNRALLARQMLLDREDAPVVDAVERLVGIQAQTANSPYLALWSRLADFRPEALRERVAGRDVVRIALMRGTIHSVSARDCLALRPLFAAVLTRQLRAGFQRPLKGIDAASLVRAGRALVEERPRTFAELGRLLRSRWRTRDAQALALAIRAWVPLVQVPPRGLWGSAGPAAHTSAEAWLLSPLDPDPSTESLVLRYLAGFGPATVADFRLWSGLQRAGEVFDRLRPRLRELRDEDGRELFDLPDAPRPPADTPAPPRFLPEFDNAFIGFADRSRIVADADRGELMAGGALLTGTVLVDGFVRARWRIDDRHLVVAPFRPLSKRHSAAVEREGERLLEFVAPGVSGQGVSFRA